MASDTTPHETPIDPDEAQDLLIPLRAQDALNRAEEQNIVAARGWAEDSRLVRSDLLSEVTLRRIHREMFGAVWKWAGTYRHTDKNIGRPPHQLPELMHQLCGNFAFRVQTAKENRDALAVDFHHQLVSIHAFPNGNGRHARFCADRLVENLGGSSFAWGLSDWRPQGDARARYVAALQDADRGNLAPLISFARSGEMDPTR